MSDDAKAELRAVLTRAACEEARRQAALERGDHAAARDAETELSRLWARACDLERQERVA